MKSQYCKKNEADKVFYVNWMGGIYQIAMCEECMKKMWQKAGAAGQEDTFKKYTGWWPGKLEERKPGERLFPEDAGDLLKRKRQLSALQNRLHEAAEAENYEEAARLRDDIAVIEKEVYSHENCTGSV